MTAALLRVQGLAMRFPGSDGGPEVLVLDGVDLEMAAGESVAIVGPSGSGKSTLLHLIGGLLPPSAGRIELGGQELQSLAADALARVRNLQLGFVFQDHHLLPQCSVLENVLVPVLAGFASPRDAEARARELLQRVGLGERLRHRPAALSGGERQRVAVVRALINRPQLLLADEPTGALDGRGAGELVDLLVELQQEHGIALLVVTHAPAVAARMQRVLTLGDGRLLAGASA